MMQRECFFVYRPFADSTVDFDCKKVYDEEKRSICFAC